MGHASDCAQATDQGIEWQDARRVFLDHLTRRLPATGRDHLEDLVQEASLRLLRMARRETIENLPALMHTIAKRTSIDFIRRQQRARLFSQPLPDDLPSPEPGRGRRAEVPGDPLERVRFVILEFFRQRRAGCLELAQEYFRGRTWAAVAEALNATHDGIRARWSRCIRLLREEIERDQALRDLLDWLPDGREAAP